MQLASNSGRPTLLEILGRETAHDRLTFADRLLPLALGIIMLGLGLSLTLADFARVVKYPKPVVVGLACQILLLPLVCFLIANGLAWSRPWQWG